MLGVEALGVWDAVALWAHGGRQQRMTGEDLGVSYATLPKLNGSTDALAPVATEAPNLNALTKHN